MLVEETYYLMPRKGVTDDVMSHYRRRMSRKPEVPGKPARNVLVVRVHDEMLEWIDAQRGEGSRSGFIRELIRKEHRRGLR